MALRVSSTMRIRIDAALRADGDGSSLLVDETLPDEVRGMISYLHASAERTIDEITKDDTHRPNVYFDFIEDDAFNAYATHMDPDYFILVNTGVVTSLPALFRNLLSLPQFATGIGDPSLETLPPIARASEGLEGRSFIDTMPRPERTPRCPVRRQAAARLAHTAMKFVVLHELGHIRNGHLRFFDSGARTMFMLDEAGTRLSAPRNKLASHTLEYDADSHAVVRGVNDVINLTGRRSHPPDPLDALYATPEGSLYVYLLSAFALLRAFGRTDSWSPKDVWKNHHPPVAIRQYALAGLVSAHLARLSFRFASPDRASEITRDIALDIERAFSLLTGWKPDLSDFALAIQLWHRVYGRQLTEFWITAHPQLDRLKLGGRLAPPEPWLRRP